MLGVAGQVLTDGTTLWDAMLAPEWDAVVRRWGTTIPTLFDSGLCLHFALNFFKVSRRYTAAI